MNTLLQASILVSLLLGAVLPGCCTTIIVRYDNGRIFIATDTRRMAQSADGNIVPHDDQCKIVFLGRTALAITGMESYEKGGPFDLAPEWNAFDDAKDAYRSSGDDLIGLADDWAQRVARHFSDFNAVHPDRVTALAQMNTLHSLTRAMFIAWVDNSPTLVIRVITLDSSLLQAPTVTVNIGTIPVADDGVTYTSSSVTQELVNAKTGRAAEAERRWADESKKYPESERSWRYLQFLITETSKLEQGVSPQSDILAIPFDGDPYWIEKSTCK
jgi:hypothetical protein